MTAARDVLVIEMAQAMDNINDVHTNYEDLAEVAIETLEGYGLSLVDRDEIIIEMGDIFSDTQYGEAQKGNYNPEFCVYAEAALTWLATQEVALPVKTLAESMPAEFTQGEYNDTPAYKLRDVGVATEYRRSDGTWKPWPGQHRNVHFWVVLTNGKAVAFNEGTNGWGFPVIGYTR